VDPRRAPLLALVEAAVADGVVAGRHLRPHWPSRRSSTAAARSPCR
jgi:hypothetical protein